MTVSPKDERNENIYVSLFVPLVTSHSRIECQQSREGAFGVLPILQPRGSNMCLDILFAFHFSFFARLVRL